MDVFVHRPSQRGRLGSGGSDSFLTTVSYPGKGCAPWHFFGPVVVQISSAVVIQISSAGDKFVGVLGGPVHAGSLGARV